MTVGISSPFSVLFSGPPMTRNAREALRLAGISVVRCYPRVTPDGEMRDDYRVTVDARDAESACTKVRRTVESHGAYWGFSPDVQ